jgi:glutamate 5-kinase
MNDRVRTARRLVVKVGSSLVTNEGAGLDLGAVANWARQIAALGASGREIVLVSSGAIAEGMKRLGWRKRPGTMHELQAAAAVGQMGLAQAYESSFRDHGLRTAQILLTHADLADRERYLNARSTLKTLLDLGVVPVINENDTVVTDEIRVGDNDTLASLVANLIEADILIILTDQGGLYTADPRKDSAATLVTEAHAGDPRLEDMAGGAGSALGRGGMITKVLAAKRAARSGAHTVVASGREPEVLVRLGQGEAIGTLLVSDAAPLAARKQWLADHVQSTERCTWMPVRHARSPPAARACFRSACERSPATSSGARSSHASDPTVARSRVGSRTMARSRRGGSSVARRPRSNRSSATWTSPSSSTGTIWWWSNAACRTSAASDRWSTGRRPADARRGGTLRCLRAPC